MIVIGFVACFVAIVVMGVDIGILYKDNVELWKKIFQIEYDIVWLKNGIDICESEEDKDKVEINE